MDFAKMRNDGFSDLDIVESLRSNELLKDTADFDGLRQKGIGDTQIVDMLNALPSFHEDVAKRKENYLSSQTPPSTPTPMPSQPQEEGGFLGTIKKAGESLLKNLFDGKSASETLDAMHTENKQKIAAQPVGVAKDVAQGMSKLGDGIDYVKNDAVPQMVKGMDNAIEGIENPTLKTIAKASTYMPTPMGGLRVVDALSMSDKERKIADVKAYAENMSQASLLYENLFGEDTVVAKDSFDKISQALMKTDLADTVEMDNNNQLWITKDGQEYRVEDGFLKNLASTFKAYEGTIVGGTTGAIVAPLLATAGKIAPSPAAKVGLSALGAMAGSVIGAATDQQNASASTGLSIDPQHLLKKMTEEGVLSLAADGVVYGAIQGAKAIKPAYQAGKDFITGDARAYTQMKTDLRIDDDYTKGALDKLNGLLETPLSDTKQARMYATALEHEQGLSVMQEVLRRSEGASNTYEGEVVRRTQGFLKLLEDNAVTPKEILSYLEASSEKVSAQYGAMRDILRNELKDVPPVTIDTDAVAITLKEIGAGAHDPDVKSGFKSLASFIKNNPNYTSDIDGLLELRQDINRFFGKRNVKEWVAPDNAKVSMLIKGIDEAIYKTFEQTGEQNAKALKEIFEAAKDDYSAMKKAEASSFFKKLDADGLTSGQRAGRLVKGLSSDDESAQKVLSQLSPQQRERLEITAIHEVIQKEISGSAGGLKAVDFEDVIVKLRDMSENMNSKAAKDTLDFVEKMGEFFAKDKELIKSSNPLAKSENPLSTSLQGKLHISMISKVLEWIQRKIPFSEHSRRLDVYYRLGKYMETSHDTKGLLLKLYNDPLNSQSEKVFFGKALSNLKSGGDDALGGYLEHTDLPPDGGNGGGGVMSSDDIKALWEKETPDVKNLSEEEIKAKVQDIVEKKYGVTTPKGDEPNPPSGGGNPTKGADNGVQGQEKEVTRQSVADIEATTGKTLDQLGDEDGFFTHYSTHEFDTLSANQANLGKTGGRETKDGNIIPVTFVYKKGASVENPIGIGKEGQFEHKIDLRDKKIYEETKATDADKQAYKEAYLDIIAKEPNLSFKDKQNKALHSLGYDGIGDYRQIELWVDAPVVRSTRLSEDVPYAGMPKRGEHLPPVSAGGLSTDVKATIEATPSTSDTLYNLLVKASPNERLAYEEAHVPLVKELAQSYGLDVDIAISKGAYLKDGALQNNPVMVVTINNGTKNVKKFGQEVSLELEMKLRGDDKGNLSLLQNEEAIESFLKEYGAGTNQDSVPWYTPIFRGSERGSHRYFTIIKELDDMQFDTLSKALVSEHGSLNPQIIDGQLRIMDFNDTPLPKEIKDKIIHNALNELYESSHIDKKMVEFDSIGKLLEQGKDYERKIFLRDSAGTSRRPNLSEATNSDNEGNAFAKSVQDIRREWEQRLGTGETTIGQTPRMVGDGIEEGRIRPERTTPQQVGEQLATDLKDAPKSNFKGGYVTPEALSFMAKTLTGATGGSLTEYDYNKDGVIDYQDKAIGAALGIVGFHALTSKPAFAAYKNLAEHAITKLETRAESGDLIAQMALGTRYIYANEKGIAGVAPFVSKASELIESMPRKMDTEAFFKYLKNNSVKEDEINFSGLEDLLDKKSVTKEEVKAVFDSPKLEKKVLGGKFAETKSSLETQISDLKETIIADVEAKMENEGLMRQLSQRFKDAGQEIDASEYRFYESQMKDNLVKQHHLYAKVQGLNNQLSSLPYYQEDFGLAKFDNYKTDVIGGENYREEITIMKNKSLENTQRMKEIMSLLKQDKGTLEETSKLMEEYGVLSEKVGDTFKSAHWNEENVLYHVRKQDILSYAGGREARDAAWKKVDEARNALEDKYSSLEMKWDKTDPLYKTYRDAVDATPKLKDKEKMLLVEEIQSDWHQEGRKTGYRKALTNAEQEELQSLKEAYRDPLSEFTTEQNQRLDALLVDKVRTPQAPYAKTWHEKAMKDVIKEAVENGYDRVSWVAGKEQADRYSLAKQVKHVRWYDDVNLLQVEGLNGDTLYREITEPEKVGDIIGKEAANKLLKTDKKVAPYTNEIYRELIGDGLEVGGEGMKGFYDKILPEFTAKYIKKFDAKVEKIELSNGQKVWSFQVTPKMKEDVSKKGQYLYSLMGLSGAGLASQTINDNEKGTL